MWIVVDDKTYLITCCVICCAKCHFLPFLPVSSISHPPSWKMLPVAKTPENSTLRAYHLVLPAYDTIRGHFWHYRTKIREWRIGIDGAKNWSVARCALHVLNFLVNTIYLLVNTIYYITVNLIYSTIHIISTILLHNTSHIHYNYIDITILISLYNTVTIL